MRQAQRLRHRVFAEEMGARLDSPITGLDVDPLDAYCDHLLVRHAETDEVVGTYRLLAPRRADRLYSESEFDLAALAGIRPAMVEAGRACVHPDHRGGAVIGLMWAGIARYMAAGGYGWLGGCCSVPVADADGIAERVPLSPPEYRVRPHRPWRPDRTFAPVPVQAAAPPRPGEGAGPVAEATARPPLPPLLRAYLRLGAWVCGPPAHDPAFGTADFFVLLPMGNLHTRYLRRFLGGAS
ncbi:putative hemolysin [Streptosporangium becharense]|uniref:Putative hemolysin n=1 Tax=Streptosporangium becharense TaxID=1816182 RepID=A0A7W9MH22_9ACTN|nr:GNAT family N-acyltransferase [Streptosporangium becharense]MBB2908978.1 putative hemolysin [Streptosporangium becharense]MBB5820004.1 putative hemolysin [Streptosporangium becharense]